MTALVSSERRGLFALVAACLSFLSCSAITWSIRLERRHSRSYHLMLVWRLLMSDNGLALSIIIYYIIQKSGLDYDHLSLVCSAYLPTVLFCFLMSYSFTTLLAIRFRSSYNLNPAANKPPVPLWAVKYFCMVPPLTVMIMAYAYGGVTKLLSKGVDANKSCTFNHATNVGIALDILSFQLPLILAVTVNIYLYGKTLIALRNSPRSVVERQFRRAVGYILVMAFVWIPNIIYNFISINRGRNSVHTDLLDAVVLLTALQGFLNSCVYVWTNRSMRRWLIKNSVLFRWFRTAATNEKHTNAHDNAELDHNLGSSKDRGDTTDEEYALKVISDDDEEEEDDDDDSEWLAKADHDVSFRTDGNTVTVQNPINRNNAQQEEEINENETVTSERKSTTRSSRSSLTFLRGILVGGQHYKSRKDENTDIRNSSTSTISRYFLPWFSKNDVEDTSTTHDDASAQSHGEKSKNSRSVDNDMQKRMSSAGKEVEELDNEKFVHFGANVTHRISFARTSDFSARSSEFSITPTGGGGSKWNAEEDTSQNNSL